ncbi:MAG TPA: hypothetical protein VFP97_15360 [Chitinophagaceae bacterium]|nr:hypothetical protein [Chitinophagaceae bacterium]
MNYVLSLALAGVFIACTDNSGLNDTGTHNSSPGVATTSTSIEQKHADTVGLCFMKITDRDTAVLMLEQKANEISGVMLYDNFEKDGSRGTVKGKKEGDIFKLFYDFNAEGTRSVMEVYFKEVPGGLLRGVGDMDVKADTAYFRSGINYSVKDAFSKVDCNVVKTKFQ